MLTKTVLTFPGQRIYSSSNFKPRRWKITEKLNEGVRMPTGKELADSIQNKFERDVLPVLKENERWRARSRHIDLTTCLPGHCPKPGDWPTPKIKLDEDD